MYICTYVRMYVWYMYICTYVLFSTVGDFLTHCRATNTQQQIPLKFTGWRHPQVLHGEAVCETVHVSVHTTLNKTVCESRNFT